MDDHWPRIRALLEGDILWRSRQLATGGAHALFEDLHETITWHGSRLTVADPHHHHGMLSGEGLLLTPSVMSIATRQFISKSEEKPNAREQGNKQQSHLQALP